MTYTNLTIRPQDVKRGKLFPEDYIPEVVETRARTGKRLPMGEFILAEKMYCKEIHGSGAKYKNAVGGFDNILMPLLEALDCRLVGVHFKLSGETFFSRFEAVKLAGFETLGNSFFRWGRRWIPLDVCGRSIDEAMRMRLPSKYSMKQEQEPQEKLLDHQLTLFEESEPLDAYRARMVHEQ